MAPARLAKFARLLEILHRQNSRHDRNIDAAGADAVEVAKVEIVIEEELRDRAGRAGVDLGLEHVDIGIEARAFRMLLRIGRHRDFDIAMPALDRGDEIGRAAVALRMRRVGAAETAGGIAAQRHDVADADLVIARHDVIDVGAGASTQVRCAAGVRLVSPRMRAMVEWVRSRVDPPAP